MPDVTLAATHFPDGTEVSAYPVSNWPIPGQPSGEPIGDAAATEVADNGAAFADLDAGDYWAVGEVDGSYRYVRFTAGEDVAQGDELEQAVAAAQTAADAHASRHEPGGADAFDFSTVNMIGLLADRPAAAAGNANLTYFATDDNGGTEYLSDGTDWWVVSARGITLDRASRTTNLTAQNNTTYADIGPSITFTPRMEVPIRLVSSVRRAAGGGTFAAGGIVAVYLGIATGAGSVVAETNEHVTGNAHSISGLFVEHYLEVGDFTVGVPLTYKIQSKLVSGSVTSPVYSLIANMYLRAVEEV